LIYEKGQGVAQDNSLAFSWYSKAAAQGDAQAQYNLGVMYEKGVGVAKDSKQAATFYREAAKQGLAAAVTALKKSRVEKLKSDDVPDSEVIQ
jgi:TPR repeat protein